MSPANIFGMCLSLAIFVHLVSADPHPMQVRTTCGTGWDQLGIKCYKTVKSTKTSWAEAEVFCNAVGGHLAVPTNPAENSYIQGLAVNRELEFPWIGVTDIDGENRWVSSVSHQPIQFTDWDSGEPNNFGGIPENCVGLNTAPEYKWNDATCVSKWHFICEKNPH